MQANRAKTGALADKEKIKDDDKAERIRVIAGKQFDAELDDLEALFDSTCDLTPDDPKYLAKYYYAHRAKGAGLTTVLRLAKLAGAAVKGKPTTEDLIARVTARVNSKEIDEQAEGRAQVEISRLTH